MKAGLWIADRNRRLEEVVFNVPLQNIKVFCLKLDEVYLNSSEILTKIEFSITLSHDF